MQLIKYSFHYSLILAVFLVISGCSEKSTPEAAIRAHIATAQQAVEDKDARKAIAVLAENFTGNQHMDKQSLRRLLALLFLQHNNINVAITRLDITINDYDPSTARMDAVVLATGAERLLPQNGRMLQVSGDWQNIDNEWLLMNLTWK